MVTSGTCGPEDAAEVVLGVDTHLEFHVAVVLDRLGRRLGELKVPTTLEGYGELVRWAEGFGIVACAGAEGTGSYGAGLARHLIAVGIAVVEGDLSPCRKYCHLVYLNHVQGRPQQPETLIGFRVSIHRLRVRAAVPRRCGLP